MSVFAFLLQAFSGSEGGGQGGIPAGRGPSHLQGSHQGNLPCIYPDTQHYRSDSEILWIRIRFSEKPYPHTVSFEVKSRIRICIKVKSLVRKAMKAHPGAVEAYNRGWRLGGL
jgi:hypothetical protein